MRATTVYKKDCAPGAHWRDAGLVILVEILGRKV